MSILKKKKNQFYSLKNILDKDCHYNMIIGERSNGKTYSVLEYGIKDYLQNGNAMALIRRWDTDFRGKRASAVFDALVSNNLIEKLSNGQFNNVHYYSGRWYLCSIVDNERVFTDIKPFAYAFSLNTMEHDKSTSFPNVRTILFDEFLTRTLYLADEFVIFMNTLSTIIRQRKDIKIFMCGNTVNKYSPYFSEMGLTNIKTMKQGEIDVYEYGESGLKVAVEFSDTPSKKKESDVFFAFDNPKLSMITGKGASVWEINIYPHCPFKLEHSDIAYIFFIDFNDDLLQCEIVTKNNSLFLFIHEKTTPLRHPDTDLIYSPKYDPRPNWRRKINKPFSKIEKRIFELFAKDKIFYQNNEVGETVRNYLNFCQMSNR